MASRATLCLCIMSGLLFGTADSATAQNESYSRNGAKDSTVMLADPAVMPDSGRYDRHALRFESHHGRITIIEGADGAVVGRTVWFKRFDLASLVASSERAVAEARAFNGNRRAGEWALSLGFVVFAVDAIMARATGDPNAVSVVTGIGSAAIMVYGFERLAKANQALSKSLWWYNRDLKK